MKKNIQDTKQKTLKLEEKLKGYSKLTAALSKPLTRNFTTLGKVGLSLAIPMGAYNVVHAQCSGSFMGGAAVSFIGGAVPVDIDKDGNDDINIFITAGGATQVQGLGGVKILGTTSTYMTMPGNTYTYNNAKVFALNDPIPGAGVMSFTTATLAYGTGASGNWAGGTTGNLGVVTSGGTYGFVSLSFTGTGAGRTFSIDQMGFADDPGETISAGDCATLPVELIDFKVVAIKNHIALSWETASEVNNAGFEIERSEDGKAFKTLGFVEGKGNSLINEVYGFQDEKVQLEQTYVYRLKQIDFDGNYQYSEMISAVLKGVDQPKGEFVPNPVESGLVQLTYYTPEAGRLHLKVFDVTGKELWNKIQEVLSGTNNLSLDFATLAAGTYFIKMEQDGNNLYDQIIIK